MGPFCSVSAGPVTGAAIPESQKTLLLQLNVVSEFESCSELDCAMEDEDMSHDGAPASTLPQELMEEFEADAGGSQGAIAPPPDDARASFEQRRARSSHGARFRERSDSMNQSCLLYTSPSPRDLSTSRMPSSA